MDNREHKKRLKLATHTDIRKALSRVANMLINDEIDTKVANSITLICNAILGAIRLDEQQKKINELEILLNQQEYKKKHESIAKVINI